MATEIERGTIVLASDPYENKRRPFVVVSDSSYPFFPYGYLGIPVTTKDKENTHEIEDRWKETIYEELHVNPSYVNPWSPSQVNNPDKEIMVLSEDFIDILCVDIVKSFGWTV